ncbi:MAG: enoyl-CoA hydratase/isomerase family protein [Labilithrix sp.]|nr:enoyl-CoA hydratase/isomerase family protein [Labilithrix sp.]
MIDVLFEELPTACGRSVGVATLNAPAALNALSLSMVRALTPMLRQWAYDNAIVGVVLQGAGEKAFCAGGDLRELYESLRANPGEPSDYARGFFAEEYQLDYLIHTFDKPILCWGHGIVMGGGIGLMSGASHRVVTSQSRLAMPEITVGLYPDVGGSWLLRRMPGRLGLFLALTGASLNAADALFCGLADLHLSAGARAEVLAAIQATSWSDSPRQNHAELSRVLARHEVRDLPRSNVREHFDLISELMAGDDLVDIAVRLRGLRREDPWLSGAAATFAKGSPTSAALAFELRRRVKHASLADVFRLEYDVSLGCSAHSDFVEGIRALLIAKDKSPRWSPASLEEVTTELVEDHFRPRWAGAHPLAALSATFGSACDVRTGTSLGKEQA